MGCQTGFYLVVSGEPTVSEIIDLLNETMEDAASTYRGSCSELKSNVVKQNCII